MPCTPHSGEMTLPPCAIVWLISHQAGTRWLRAMISAAGLSYSAADVLAREELIIRVQQLHIHMYLEYAEMLQYHES